MDAVGQVARGDHFTAKALALGQSGNSGLHEVPLEIRVLQTGKLLVVLQQVRPGVATDSAVSWISLKAADGWSGWSMG